MSFDENSEPLKQAHQRGKVISQSAMSDGLKVGGVFATQALALLIYNLGIISTLLFLAAAVAVPVTLYKLGVRFRDQQMGGSVRYIQIVGYLSWTYVFSLIVAFLAYYLVTYKLFNDTTFISLIDQSVDLLTEIYKDRGVDYEQALSAVRGMTPLQIVGTITMNALFNGIIYIYIIGFFIKKSDKKNE